MAMFAISKNLFCKFYSCSSRQAIISSQANSYLLTHFDIKHRRYYCSKTKWITIILEKKDGTHFKRKGKCGETLWEVLYNDPDFPEYGVCEAAQGCSTCHVIFTKEDFDTINKYNFQSEDELDLLDGVAKQFSAINVDFPTDTSRLGCCIKLIPEMDGKVIKLPKTKPLTNT